MRRTFHPGLAFLLALGVPGSVPAARAQWQVANPTPGQTFTRLVVGGDGQVAGATVESFGLMVSPTGTGNWRSQVLPKAIDGSATVQDLLWANGRWVAASPGYIHSSTDLANWTASEPLSTAPYALAWDGSKYWAFGYANRVAHSSDAVTWTQLPNNDLKIPQPAEAVWFNHRFVVVGQNTIASSADGSAWTTHVSASPYYVGDVESGGGRLIAVGSNLGGPTTNFFRSTDGTTWSPIAAPASSGRVLRRHVWKRPVAGAELPGRPFTRPTTRAIRGSWSGGFRTVRRPSIEPWAIAPRTTGSSAEESEAPSTRAPTAA
jgi:hypothetical protein